MKLNSEQISAVTGGNGGNTLDAVEFMPIEGLDGIYWGRTGSEWILANFNQGNAVTFESERDAIFAIGILRKARRMYERGFDQDYIEKKIKKMMKQRIFSN